MELTTKMKVCRRITLEENEAKLTLMALDYLYHRHTKHGKFPEMEVAYLQTLRTELREALSL